MHFVISEEPEQASHAHVDHGSITSVKIRSVRGL